MSDFFFKVSKDAFIFSAAAFNFASAFKFASVTTYLALEIDKSNCFWSAASHSEIEVGVAPDIDAHLPWLHYYIQ